MSESGVYVKLPVEVAAFRWEGDWDAMNEWLRSLGYDGWETANDDGLPPMRMADDGTTLIIDTLEGDEKRAGSGEWWLIRGVRGEFYPIRSDIFAETYRPAIAQEESTDGR